MKPFKIYQKVAVFLDYTVLGANCSKYEASIKEGA